MYYCPKCGEKYTHSESYIHAMYKCPMRPPVRK